MAGPWRPPAHPPSSASSFRSGRRPPAVAPSRPLRASPESGGFSLSESLYGEHMSYRIGIIGGDGIGPEVVAEAVKCLDASGVGYDATTFDLGWERYERDGVVLPDEDLE